MSPGGWWRAAAVAALAAACYGNTLGNDFVWDDRLTAIAPGDPATALARTGPYWRPLVMLSFRADRAVWGERPAGFHLTNLLAHAAVGWLVGAFAQALGATPGAALAAALCFVAHPVQTEAVSYVSGRTDVLCALCALGALLAWRRARGAADGFAVASAALVLAALGCKETAVLVPLVLLVPGAHPAPSPPRPWLPVAAAGACGAAWIVTAAPPAAAGDLVGRVPAIVAVLLEYARLLAWPLDLHLERFVVVPGRPAGVVAAHAALAAVLLSGLVVVAARARALPALGLAVATYLPASGVVPVYPAIADRALFAAEHLLYLPLGGLAALAGVAAARAGVDRRAGGAAVAACLVAWVPLTILRNRDWRDERTLFTHTIRYDPPTARVWYDLANLHLAGGDPAEAERLYRAALDRDRSDGAIHLNLGIALQRQGRRGEAAAAYAEALRLDPTLARAFDRRP